MMEDKESVLYLIKALEENNITESIEKNHALVFLSNLKHVLFCHGEMFGDNCKGWYYRDISVTDENRSKKVKELEELIFALMEIYDSAGGDDIPFEDLSSDIVYNYIQKLKQQFIDLKYPIYKK